MKRFNTSDGKQMKLTHIPPHLMDQIPSSAEMQDSALPVAQYRGAGVWHLGVDGGDLYFETAASAECFVEDTWDVE